jgi:hypothetical protein
MIVKHIVWLQIPATLMAHAILLEDVHATIILIQQSTALIALLITMVITALLIAWHLLHATDLENVTLRAYARVLITMLDLAATYVPRIIMEMTVQFIALQMTHVTGMVSAIQLDCALATNILRDLTVQLVPRTILDLVAQNIVWHRTLAMATECATLQVLVNALATIRNPTVPAVL